MGNGPQGKVLDSGVPHLEVEDDISGYNMKSKGDSNSLDSEGGSEKHLKNEKMFTRPGALKTEKRSRRDDGGLFCEKPTRGEFLGEIQIQYRSAVPWGTSSNDVGDLATSARNIGVITGSTLPMESVATAEL